MAVNYATALKTTRLNAVVSAIDAGSGAGVLEIGTTGFASTLAQITLNDPCATVSGDTLTFDVSPVPSDSSANATGTAAEARIKDSDGNVIVSGLTVTASGGGGNIIIGSTSITSGQAVSLTSGTITHAA